MKVSWAVADKPIAAIDAFLENRGVRDGEPVAFECTNSVPGALTLLALLSRGATFALLPAPGPAVAAQPLPRFLRHRIRVRSPYDEGYRQHASLEHPETFLDITDVEDHRSLPVDSRLRRGRLLLRTSGSVDSPKLCVHTHAGALGNARNALERLDLRGTDRVFIPVPLAHMYGLGAAFLPALSVGASVELCEGTNLLRYMEHERRFRPTVVFVTPNLCATLLRPRATPADHYRHMVVAGDKLSPESFEKAEALYGRVVNLYGSTELGVICAADAREAEGPRAATVGRPLPGVKLRLEARPGLAERHEEGVGDLLCAHPHPFEGYVDNDGCSVPGEAGLEAGWYATRDLARIAPNGLVEVLGRSDHAVKRDGRLVMLVEVERAMERLSGVERAAAIVTGETKRGRGVVAFCVPRRGAALDAYSLRRSCQEVLPAHAVPDEVFVLPALPLLPSGKLDRRALGRVTPDRPSPSNPTEP